MSASVLIIEDEAVTALDLRELLEGAGYTVVGIAATANEAIASVERSRPDLALVDIQLADGSDGISVAEVLVRRVGCPVIFLTAHGDSSIVARAEAVGPAAFLLKPFNEREVTIAVRLTLAKHESDRVARGSERRYATTITSLSDGVIVVGSDGRVLLLNPAAAAITGLTPEGAIGQLLQEVLAAERAVEALPDQDPGRRRHAPDERWRLRHPSGGIREIICARAPLIDDHGASTGTVLVLRDITELQRAAAERTRLEQRLQEAQRVESLGVIASGIAHDFNNILAYIGGNAELALAETAPTSAAYAFLTQVSAGVSRASELTRQLLTYAGKGPLALQEVDLNTLLREMGDLARASTGPQAQLVMRCAEGLPPLMADPVQIRQVILNLLTNAAEALLGSPGTITLSTCAVALGSGAELGLEGGHLPPGVYVELRVDDTGCGMDATTMARVFDLFFTTKRTGRGLGLAAVRGIVQRHRGTIRISSAPGVGTTMRILLPAARSQAERRAPSPPAPAARPEGGEPHATPAGERGLVLVIDDEVGVREITARFLERLGYRAVIAASGREGIPLLERDPQGLRGVVLDLNMPGESGYDVAAALRAVRAELPLVLMSGYQEEPLRRLSHPELTRFLQKPFRLSELKEALLAIGL